MSENKEKIIGNVIKKRKQKLVKHKRKNWKKTNIVEIEKKIERMQHYIKTHLASKLSAKSFFLRSAFYAAHFSMYS